jgi:hypothetical protein
MVTSLDGKAIARAGEKHSRRYGMARGFQVVLLARRQARGKRYS